MRVARKDTEKHVQIAVDHSLFQEHCPLYCAICNRILYSMLPYIISMQKAVILFNKYSLQGMSIKSH